MRIRSARLLTASTALAAPNIVHMSAYANTLTGLLGDIFMAVDVVSRELVGFVPSVSRAPTAERAAKDQAVTYTIFPEMSAVDIAPAMSVPEPADVTVTTGTMTMNKARAVPFGFTGEEQRGLNTGAGALTIQGGLIAQGLRTLVNEMETDVAAAATAAACRAYGTGGATPFASDLAGTAQTRKILDDNGAPLTGRSMILNTSAGANLRTLKENLSVADAGTAMTLRQGTLMDHSGFMMKESGQAVTHTAGTGASATTDANGYAEGATEITLASAGTGTILKGDVIKFAGDANKYVVTEGDADVSGGGSIKIAAPGLRVAIAASATAITVESDYDANIGFSPDAIHLATRLPALPQEGDAAVDRQTIVDPRSGIAFEFAIYAGYRKMRGEIGAVWGVEANKPAHIAMLLG